MKKEWIKKVSTDLQLEPILEDWILMNSDPERIEEFIDYYEWNKEENTVEDPEELEILAQLICNSAEDGFAMDAITDEIKERLREFIKANAKDFPKTYDQWSATQSEEWKALTA